ncbi:GNAT family N-acetyltransferase [Haliscomenobacter sp.]|uniref:GNAT family N-acetyltransferase n=1 Tax=Haliscomenobacter sp. TaxID=2717303 RepID=UPI0033651EC9
MVRSATAQDFSFFYSLYMHPQINPFLMYEQMDEEAFQPIFHDLQSQNQLFVFEYEGQMAGMFKIVPFAHRTSHIAYLGGVAIHPDFAGKGLGTQMLHEIIAHCGERGFLRLELSTATINERAIKLYEKVGFEKEGVYRNYCWLKSENRFLDEVVMSYLYPQ